MSRKVFGFIGKRKKSVKMLNALKRSFIAEHLVNNHIFTEHFNIDRFKIIKGYGNIFDLIKLEAIFI